jgi:carbonic anhydrase
MTRERQAAMSPAQAIRKLREGNMRFITGRPLVRNIRAQVAIEEQFPFAAIVSCIDSRTSNELVFDQGPGDIFSSRIAGNVIDASVLGGLEFACRVAGAKAIVVVGHTSCGAVKGAIDQIQLGHLTSVLQRIEPAIELALPAFARRSSSDPRFVEAVTHANVRVAMRRIGEDSGVLREMIERGELAVAGAVVDLATGRASFLED